MNTTPEELSAIGMAVDTIGVDLLNALLAEISTLPDVWQKMSKRKQDEVIDRLRRRIESDVKMAVHLIASEGRTVVAGALEQITIKDGVKAVVKFHPMAHNLHEFYDSNGKEVLVVVANPEAHTAGMDDVQGEDDQRAMSMGHEYNQNNRMGDDFPKIREV